VQRRGEIKKIRRLGFGRCLEGHFGGVYRRGPLAFHCRGIGLEERERSEVRRREVRSRAGSLLREEGKTVDGARLLPRIRPTTAAEEGER
jgi:hypothetical protein